MIGQLLSSRWFRVLLGLIAGAAVGLAVFSAGHLKGAGLFILAGAAAGAVAAALVQFYSRTIRLTDITITVPQFSEMHFAVTRDSQQVAWKLFVEAVTRISTQPLSTGDGLLREALSSLYGLFSITRDVLKLAQPSVRTGKDPTVEHLAIAMLNNELRPFLSHWHPALLEWEKSHEHEPEATWPLGAECRAQLISMQRRLEQYVLGFGKLAGLPNAKEILDGTLAFRSAGQTAPQPGAQAQPAESE